MLSELADGEVGEVASVLAEQHLVDAAEITRLEVEVTEQKHELGAQAEALRLRRAQTLQEQARIHELTSENRKLKSALSADELARSAEMIAELQAENEELIEQLGLGGGKKQRRSPQQPAPPGPPAMAPASASGWQLVNDGSGAPYYWNTATNAVQYEMPPGFDAAAAAGSGPGGAEQSGWQEVDDGTNPKYYWNTVTNEVQFERPRDFHGGDNPQGSGRAPMREWQSVAGLGMNYCNASESTLYFVQDGQVKRLKF